MSTSAPQPPRKTPNDYILYANMLHVVVLALIIIATSTLALQGVISDSDTTTILGAIVGHAGTYASFKYRNS